MRDATGIEESIVLQCIRTKHTDLLERILKEPLTYSETFKHCLEVTLSFIDAYEYNREEKLDLIALLVEAKLLKTEAY